MLEDLVAGNLETLNRGSIYLNEVDVNHDDDINFRLHPIVNGFWDNFKSEIQAQGSYRTFKGGNDDLEVEFSYLEIPNKDGYEVKFGKNFISNFHIYLNSLSVRFKELEVGEGAHLRRQTRTDDKAALYSAISGEEFKSEKIDRNASVEYVETGAFQKPLSPILEDKKHFIVFSNLGFDDVHGYKDLIKACPQLDGIFIEHPSENLIAIKNAIYSHLLRGVWDSVIAPEDIMKRINDFGESYERRGPSRETSFYFHAGGECEQREWARVHLGIQDMDYWDAQEYLVKKKGLMMTPIGIFPVPTSRKKIMEKKRRKKNLQRLEESRQKKLSKMKSIV